MTALASQLSLSTPTLTRSAPHLLVGTSAVVWGPQGATALHPATTLMLPYLDGETPVGELFEDAIDALGVDDHDCLLAVEADLVGLARVGVLDGLVDTEPPTEAHGEADGRFERTVVVTLDSTGAGQLPELLGHASLTDLVDDDNCVGQRLRAGHPATELHVTIDGSSVRVRSDHDQATAELEQRLVRQLIDRPAAPGPIVAYVVAPWEGKGPVRVYDRWSRRIGRPRTAAEAADVVGVLLAEWADPPGDGGVTVHATVVEDGAGNCALLDERLADAPGFHRAVRTVGWTIQPNRRVVVDPRGAVLIEGPFPERDLAFRRLAGVVTIEQDGVEPHAAAMAALLNGIAAASPRDAQSALHLLGDVLVRAPALAAPRDAAGITPALHALLGPPSAA